MPTQPHMHITGRCHCRSISFTAEIDPTQVLLCHCSDCQVLSGAPFRAIVSAPMASFVLRGSPRRYLKTAASGNRRAQVFCPDCGTPLYACAAENPNSVVIRLGCVDQRALLKPTRQVWQQSAMPWLAELATLPGSPGS